MDTSPVDCAAAFAGFTNGTGQNLNQLSPLHYYVPESQLYVHPLCQTMFYKCTEVRRKVNKSIDRVLQRFSRATQVTKDPSSPTFFTPSVDTQAYPRKDLLLSQLVFTLNEELKRSAFSTIRRERSPSATARSRGEPTDFFYRFTPSILR